MLLIVNKRKKASVSQNLFLGGFFMERNSLFEQENIKRMFAKIAIPGSNNPEHIKENISVFDFNLTEEEMNKIAKLDRNEKHDWY